MAALCSRSSDVLSHFMMNLELPNFHTISNYVTKMSKKLLLKNVVKFLAVCCTYMDRFKNKKFSLQPDSKSDRWGRIGER